MRMSFEKLSADHKWILVSLLETEGATSAFLHRISRGRLLDSSLADFERTLSDLYGSFLSLKTPYWAHGIALIDWIHPSYRDLVIDELNNSEALQEDFLRSISLGGAKIVLTHEVLQPSGHQLLLMHDQRNWRLLCDGCIRICDSSLSFEQEALLLCLADAASTREDAEQLSQVAEIIARVCDFLRGKWLESSTPLSGSLLLAYSKASVFVSPLPPFPELRPSWRATVDRLKKSAEDNPLDPSLAELVSFVDVLKETEPRFLQQMRYPDSLEAVLDSTIQAARADLQSEIMSPTPQVLAEEADRLSGIADGLLKLDQRCQKRRGEASTVSALLKRKAEELNPQTPEDCPWEDDHDDEQRFRGSRSTAEFDIVRLFSDL